MATKTDPAFLFYSKDWLSGTAEMMPDEKGVFIDLMVHQHQNGSIPTELDRIARIVGLPLSEFKRIWKVVGKKYFEEDGRLYNRKMCDIMGERKDKGWRNKITGTFAAVLRKENLNKSEYNAVRKQFKIDDWLETDSERLTERLTEWLCLCLKSIGNGDGNGDEDIDINEVIKQKKETLKNEMKSFKEAHPYLYPRTLYNKFYDYWSESLKRPTRAKAIRKDKENTWELNLRLKTFYVNDEVKYETDLQNEMRTKSLPPISKTEASNILKQLNDGK